MPADSAVQHPRAPDSWTPTPWSLGLALPAAGVGLARLLPQLSRPLPGLPTSTRDAETDADAGETRRAGSAARRTPFERFFGDLEARAAQAQHLGVSPIALPVWRLPHIAATLTLPMPSPSGTDNTALRVRLQRPQPAPRPIAVAVAAPRAKSDRVSDEPVAAAAAPSPGPSASPAAAYASQHLPAAMGAAPLSFSSGTAATGVARSAGTAPGLWAGLEAPRGAKPQAKQLLKNAAETSRAQAKARSKLRFKAFARAGAYSASLDEPSVRDDELAMPPTIPRPGPSR